jgi:hypothetical protein
MFTRRLPEFYFSVYPIKSGTPEEVDCSTALAGTRGKVFFSSGFPTYVFRQMSGRIHSLRAGRRTAMAK